MKEAKDMALLINSIVSDMGNKIERVNENLIKHGVQLDILELKVSKLEGQRFVTQTSQTSQVEQKEGKDSITLPSKIKEVIDQTIELSSTEKEVLKVLREGSKTVRDLKQKIKLSREHLARLLKSLYVKGYLERDESKKPFIYRLTSKGKELFKAE
ncbi:MAG: helix-turn-helix domain-containing protein [Nitrososphaerales archaeon]